AGGGAGGGADGDLWHGDQAPFTGLALTASRTETTPPFGPGTEPLTSRTLRSASASTTSRLSVVTCSLPMWPAIRWPRKTRPGNEQAPTEPGVRWFLWLPWLAP